MGKKIHPVGFRMGIGATWKSRWFARGAKYQQYVSEEIKKFLMGELKIKNENGLEIAPMELRFSDLSAYLVALSVAEQLARRLPAQRVMNQAIERTMRAGAKGVRIVLSGRIGGAEIARREWKAAGTMPLHTLRADIDFTAYPALTKSGYVGVKVWINKGEVEI